MTYNYDVGSFVDFNSYHDNFTGVSNLKQQDKPIFLLTILSPEDKREATRNKNQTFLFLMTLNILLIFKTKRNLFLVCFTCQFLFCTF